MNKRLIGAKYEEVAATYLIDQGYMILKRNYRCPLGEVDIIALDHEMLVFLEVKYRKENRNGTGLDAVGIHKQRTIIRVAQWFLMENCWNGACRFDVLSIDGREVSLIRDAFEM